MTGEFHTNGDHIPNVLVVGTAGTADSIQQRLSEAAVETETESAVSTAVEHVSAGAYDVVIAVDDIDALDFLTRVRQNIECEIPVILASAADDHQHAIDALNNGADQYIRRESGVEWIDSSVVDLIKEYGSAYRTQRQRVELTAQFEELLANVGVGYYRTDDTGTLQAVTQFVGDLLGYENTARLLDRDISTLYAEENPRGIFEMLPSTEGAVSTAEIRFEHTDGSTVVTETSSRRIEQNGSILGVEGVLRDITDREQYQQELGRQNERLDQAGAMVNHDLGNPLGIAKTYLQFARDTQNKDDFDAVEEALDRMEAMTADIATFARGSRSVDDVSEIDVSEIVTKSWDTVGTDASEIEIDCDDTIPVNPDRFETVFDELLQNSVEHTDHPVTVRVGDTENGIYVADDGVGIPDSDHDEIFDAGYTTKDNGNGFGLTIAESIIHAHGFGTTVGNSREGGTRFEITGIQ